MNDCAAPTQVNIIINQNFFFTQNIEINAMMESSPQNPLLMLPQPHPEGITFKNC